MRRVSWQRLSTQVVIATVAILVITMMAGFAVMQWHLKGQLNQQYEQRALAVAESLASQPAVIRGVEARRPDGTVQHLAMLAMGQTHARFIVITNARGIRYSHPDPALIGLPVYADPEPPATEPFRTGKAWLGIQRGTLGLTAASRQPIFTARGKAPVFDHGRLAGEVSVGFPTLKVSQQVARSLPALGALLAGVLAVGVLAALALARRLKRQTFGLELGEIAALLQEREAMLHGIREGVLGYDTSGRVLLANDAARRLLRLPPRFLGRPLTGLLPPGRLSDIISGEISGSDLLVVTGDRVLAVSRMPIRPDPRRHLGWVVTFHDETESESLKRDLDEAIGMTEALRAQSHEFANRMHTLAGLVELGQYDEAIRFVTDVSADRDALTEQLRAAIGDPRLVALILAKSALAGERGVELRVADDCRVDGAITGISEVLTVTGNLIDNAIEATAQAAGSRWAELTIVSAGADLLIRVRDSGPGVPDESEAVFTDGFTSKSSPTGARRGLGLALVRQIAQRRGGMVSVGRDGGAVFTVTLPGCLAAAAASEPMVPS
ncbi:MAG: sensor histidine kinase [Nocardiopsaceae bacterium]|jgi:two-component system CitB family sensor kinase|nr:sensor histidine kinase [Nocardiopsaceae bacterium]